MAGNDRRKAQCDSARNGKKSGSAATGRTVKSGKAKSSGGGKGKGGEVEHRPGRAVPIAVAAAAVAAGGAAVVVVRRRRRKAEEAAEAERGKAKRARGSSRKPGDGAAKKPRAAGGGLSQPVRPDAALGAVIGGTQPRTRAEITRQVWDYIKSKGLQDAVNRRSINADATLRPVFGKDQVTMFELPRAINDHVEKV
jgi:chromatin remodeling complex protein RSC6